MNLASIRDHCVPREDVLEGGLTDAHFAAQLDRIVRAPENDPAYGDPDRFFEVTYPTEGLKDLLRRTFGRLSGADVPDAQHGLIRSETSFGGGKTHGLIAAYHLARGARPGNLDEFVDASLLPDACRVAAIVGDVLDPVNGVHTDGQTTYTLWGEIGQQLGRDAYAILEESDRQRTAPGRDALERAFDGRPTLIIIDEIAQYLRALASSGSEDVRRLAEALPVFLKNLLEVAASNEHVVVILTLATAQDAFGSETDALDTLTREAHADAEAALDKVVDETTSVVSRFTSGGSVVKPAEDVEIGHILKRRLFERIDDAAAEEAAQRYQTLYETLTAHNEGLAGGADRPVEYARSVHTSYPFHPELIRVLDQRLGTIPGFQRARGALKLLAEAVAGIWSDQVDLPIINVGDLHYENPAVLAHVTTNLGRGAFEGVAKSDFLGPNAHAYAIDQNDLAGKGAIARRAAGTVFTHSLELQASAGAGRPEVILGTLRPGERADVAIEALAALDKTAWYLDYENLRYRFKTEPNPNAIVAAEEHNLTNTLVANEMRHRIEEAFPTENPLHVIHFPTGPESLPDTPQQLRLAILHHDDLAVESGDAPPALLTDMLGKTGTSLATRVNRNAVAFLVADRTQIANYRNAVAWDMAAHAVVDDAARMQQFDEPIRRKLHGLADQSKISARVALGRCYKHLYVPSSDRATGYLRHEELSPQSQGDVKTKQTSVIRAYLEQINQIQTAEMGVQYVQAKAWPKDAGHVATQAMLDRFWHDHGLPLVLNSNLLTAPIRKGVESGRWVYYDADTTTASTASDPPPSVTIADTTYLYTPQAAQEAGLLQKPVRVADVTDILTTTTRISGSDLRTQLEARLGGEPKKGEVLSALKNAAQGGENARAFVVQGEPQTGAKPLTPSEIERTGLDTLHVLTKAEADAIGLDLGTRVVGPRPVEANGAIGQAFQTVLNQVEDAQWPDGIRTLAITATADVDTGITPIQELHQALTMLPTFERRVDLELDFDFAPLQGSGAVNVSGTAADLEKVEDALFALADKAAGVDGRFTLEIVFDEPVAHDGDPIERLRKILLKQQPGPVTVKAHP